MKKKTFISPMLLSYNPGGNDSGGDDGSGNGPWNTSGSKSNTGFFDSDDDKE